MRTSKGHCINYSKRSEFAMDFGSDYAFVPTSSKEEYELVPERVYNHVIGYSAAMTNYEDDDGEVANVGRMIMTRNNELIACCRLVFWTSWTLQDKRNTLP